MQDAIGHERSGHRERKTILPLCPFAKSVFDGTPEYADVLVR
jgi:predicted GNAT family acetyltransferase